ncbi:MAG: beta-propeller domain-containing protein [Epsilonproteobacteria bacterium]|nr:beta-propeller domain-containing protein [Campylobacterota bacterium]
MQKVVLGVLLVFSSLLADSAILVKKGWQLVGLTTQIDDMRLFEAKNVEQVWHFDAQTQAWQGYSPDAQTQKKIDDLNLSTITSLQSWHGFWVKSKQEWPLVLTQNQIPQQSENNITLEAGWNLISLPIDTVVSPQIFDNAILWKYDNQKWKFFDQTQSETSFPTIGHINNSEGVWVKVEAKTFIDVSKHAARLHTFDDASQMESYIRDMALTHHRPYCGYFALEDSMPILVTEQTSNSGASSSSTSANMESDTQNSSPTTDKVDDASGTNLQEAEVDESDIVKHDGVNIFFVNKGAEHKVHVTTFDRVLSGEQSALTELSLEKTKYVDSLYLVENKLVVLSYLDGEFYDAYEKYDIGQPYHIPRFAIDTFDVSQIDNIHKIGTYMIDGSLSESRMVEGELILVSSFYPIVEVEYPKVYMDVPECNDLINNTYSYDGKKEYMRCYDLYQDDQGKFYRYDYENPTVSAENLLPKVVKDNNSALSLLEPKTFYVPSKKDQKATITTITKIDVDTMNLVGSSSVLGEKSVVYASSNALYLVSSEYPFYYDFRHYQERSSIYKFSIDDGISFESMGFINGHALNQFSLSEYNNTLRVATTEGSSWENETTNSIYTLGEVDGVLSQLGYLGNLGHEGETIYAVRFMADKGYVVTFRQTDPFYTLDLSDPYQPRKVGELGIEGYSSYLHPVGENLVMGIGRLDNKLKLELFDVSDFSQPRSVDLYRFDESGYYYSDVEYNHKALSFRDSDKLFTMPFSGGNYNIGYGSYLGVFQVVENRFKVYDAMIDNINTQKYTGINRGIIFDKEGVTYIAYLMNGYASFSTVDSLERE